MRSWSIGMATASQRPPSSKRESEPDRTRTLSGTPVEKLYTGDDIADLDPATDLGEAGGFPYTRGIHADMYRGKLWTMRQFSGFATPQETNRRYRYLLDHGQAGLSVAFDLPTLMGYDADDPLASGEVGKCGVAISSLADMEELFRDIPLAEVTTSMTITSSAAILWAMYLVVAEKQGADWKQISGTIQNDILKEYMAQKEYIYPPRPSMRLVVDTLEFGAGHTPKFNPISISGYHIREAGATALQELVFTLGAGVEYVKWAVERGMDIDRFAPRLSFFFDVHSDFFEEIAKFRAARKIWAKLMRDRFGAKNERSWKLRFHAQTAGVSLTAQQPKVNLVRTAIQAMAAVLGGAQSLHTNSLDEAYALPTEEAALLALRTQQVLAHETGVTEAVDPFGGSYFLERLTLDLEEGFDTELRKIEAMGGMVAAVENGYPQTEIARSSYEFQKSVEEGRRRIVGVNAYVEDEHELIPTLTIDRSVGEQQCAKLAKLRSERDGPAVSQALDKLRQAAEGDANLMPPILDAVRAYATLGEMCSVLRGVFGSYQEQSAL
jgi:methylmalonyl-CoA mutase N-terminal domain/subunit